MSRFCSLVLHAHVPWVWHPDREQSLEEDWLHSSILETYLPLLESLFRLREDEVPFQLTLNLSPTLLAMISDARMKERTRNYIKRTIKLCEDEVERGANTGFGDQASLYLERFRRLEDLFVRSDGGLVEALIDLRNSGHLELTASCATHGLLPLLLRVPEAAQAQIRAGIRQYVQTFGMMPRGFWLPECAYAPALSGILEREGIQWTIVEEHGLTQSPVPDDVFPFSPGRTEDGLAVFGRDQGSSGQIWSADEGYPGDERYRDFLWDVGLQAPMEFLSEYLGGSDQRQLTGLRYFRASRNGNDVNDLYDPAMASGAVAEHATHFVNSRGAQLGALAAEGLEAPVSVCAFDADLFGQWWFEGIEFLEQVFRKTAEREDFSFINPGSYLGQRGDLPDAAPVSSSWGEGGYFASWTTPENAWIYPEIHTRAEQLRRMVQMMEENLEDYSSEVVEHRQRCYAQMTRELLLAQSSDWAFLMRNQSSRSYAEDRTRSHLANFDEVRQLAAGNTGAERVTQLEEACPIFEDLPWNIFEIYK